MRTLSYDRSIQLFSFLFLFTFFSQQIFAQNYQQGSVQVTEETESQNPDGTVVRKKVVGKAKQRKGEMQVGEIEDDEVDQVQRRQKTLNHSLFGFGPGGSTNVGESTMLYSLTYGYRWEVTTNAEIASEFMGSTNSKGFFGNWTLGFNYMPSRGSVSPIFGLGFGLGAANGNEKSSSGFSGQLNAGVRLFRLAETQMEIMGSYATVFSDQNHAVYGVQLRILY